MAVATAVVSAAEAVPIDVGARRLLFVDRHIVEIDGSKDNNVIWTGAIAHNFSPFRDENPAADATERYKAVGGVGTKWGDGFWLLVSPDGIRWKKRDDTPLDLEGRFDSHNLLFWDAEANLYRVYWRDHRPDNGRQPGGRDVRTATAPDCRSWTASQWLVYEPARSGSAERDESAPSGDHHQFYGCTPPAHASARRFRVGACAAQRRDSRQPAARVLR